MIHATPDRVSSLEVPALPELVRRRADGKGKDRTGGDAADPERKLTHLLCNMSILREADHYINHACDNSSKRNCPATIIPKSRPWHQRSSSSPVLPAVSLHFTPPTLQEVTNGCSPQASVSHSPTFSSRNLNPPNSSSLLAASSRSKTSRLNIPMTRSKYLLATSAIIPWADRPSS